MHIALFHQYHHNPDCPATCRHYTFMEELVKRHQVTLITSDAWESKRLTRDYPWVPDGVELVSVHVPYHNRMGKVRRLQAFGSFAMHALTKGLKIPKPDVIWGVSTPLTTAWAASKVAGLRKVPWVFEVQDLWPSFPIEMGAVPSKFLQNQLYRLEKSLYRSADHIIPLSKGMEEYILSQNISPEMVTTFVNGTEVDLGRVTQIQQDELRKDLVLEGKQVVLYAGTYGRANDMPLLVETARRLQHRTDIVFVFTGQGFDEPLLEKASQELPNMLLLPPLPRHKVFTLFALAEVSVVSFIDLPVLQANSPGKLFDSLATGTPVIVTNPGWTKELVERHQCGWYVPAGDSAQLAQTLENTLHDKAALQRMNVNARKVAETQFDRLQMVPALESIFERVVATRKSR
ncbi:hypothetical protein TH61_04300 [Rufibacter sp. DG15C]|uniref:glycosyltransferase family 4 protein n=1 Tax=Rufibacter sp. DG15C TaxID=1379909 RepID=UPI00078C4BAE|nr:glycosyltransferase family 4 protein [Rufibacter sp. DG15C]AMM50553.1 hypothetical protein TH61_04300 [Rufibacter sp. DG15C]